MGAQQFISRYDYSDFVTANINDDSDSLWMITLPQRQKLIRHLTPKDDVCAAKLIIKYRVRRKANQYKKQYEVASGMETVQLTPTQCQNLKQIIQTPNPNQNVTITNALPHYIRGKFETLFVDVKTRTLLPSVLMLLIPRNMI